MVEITEQEYELFQKLKKIWIHSSPEKSGAYFICGEGGEKDDMGLPERIMVCPTYGVDGFAFYKKEGDKPMLLKEKFLSYVEMQRSANDYKDAYGIESEKTKEAYEKANKLKREILDTLDHYSI